MKRFDSLDCCIFIDKASSQLQIHWSCPKRSKSIPERKVRSKNRVNNSKAIFGKGIQFK